MKRSSSQATTVFDSAREAFKDGDYTRALELVDQSLKTTPNDATLHEFRALCLFALNRYDEAAARALCRVVGRPGLGLDDADQPLRRSRNVYAAAPGPRALLLGASPVGGGPVRAGLPLLDPGARRSGGPAVQDTCSTLQPKDQLTAQLIHQIQHTEARIRDRQQPGPPSAATTPAVAASTASTQPAGTLDGTWTAQPSPDTTITVTFVDKGHFTWKVSRKGKDQQFNGTSSYENGILTLVQEQNNNAMVGNVIWKDPNALDVQGRRRWAHRPGLVVHQAGLNPWRRRLPTARMSLDSGPWPNLALP